MNSCAFHDYTKSQGQQQPPGQASIPGVELRHVGEKCSFDAFLVKYDLGADPALQQLAEIVRGADTSRLDLTPQSGGLFAILLGLSAVFADDSEMLEHGLTVYDALYTWCRCCQGETHNWPRRICRFVGSATRFAMPGASRRLRVRRSTLHEQGEGNLARKWLAKENT